MRPIKKLQKFTYKHKKLENYTSLKICRSMKLEKLNKSIEKENFFENVLRT